jgi:hypothetical protein
VSLFNLAHIFGHITEHCAWQQAVQRSGLCKIVIFRDPNLSDQRIDVNIGLLFMYKEKVKKVKLSRYRPGQALGVPGG